MRTGVNIRKRKDGRYEARYPKGRDAAGKLLYGYCYGHSFEEARENGTGSWRSAPGDESADPWGRRTR